ncbi:trichohyalin-like [Macrobrachium nipponense]|uniref:trichohyalin-like n=1 Tax=Macrobrachium nipponense TaxID=159736 RepID=UPI0030C81061
MEQSNRLMKEELEREKEENRAHMERQSQLLKEKERLEKDIKKQAHIIEEMAEQNARVQKELMEAKMNDFVRGERLQALHTELQGLKEKVSFLENKSSKPVEEEENEASEEDLPEESVPLPQQVSHLSNEEETLENQGLKANRRVRLKRNSLPGKLQANEEQKEEEKVIVTVKKRAEETKREDQGEVEKDARKDNKGCQKPQRVKKTDRKLITFNLEPDQPQPDKRVFSRSTRIPPQQEDNSIIFRGEKVKLRWIEETDGEVIAELAVARRFHKAINGIQGRTLEEITNRSGVTLIALPGKLEKTDLITIAGRVHQVRLAANHIERLINNLY